MRKMGLYAKASLPSDRGEPVKSNSEQTWKPSLPVIGEGAFYEPDPKVYMTVRDASKHFGVPTSTITQWIRNGQVKATMGFHGNRENVWHVEIKSIGRRIHQ